MFRQEAVDELRNKSTGEILLSQGLSARWLTGLFVVIALAIITFLLTAGTTRKEVVQGVLLPSKGLIRVVPIQSGVVIRRAVREGQTVRAGDVLYVLSAERSAATQGAAGRTVSDLIIQRRSSLELDQIQLRRQNDERLAVARRKAQDLAEEQQRIDVQIAVQTKRVALAEGVVSRYRDLLKANFVSAAQLDDKTADLLDQQQKLAELQRAKANAGRDQMLAIGEARAIELQVSRDDQAAIRAQASLSQDLTANEAQREVSVLAPQDGLVVALPVDVGQTVAPSQLLASIVPTGSMLEAELYLPSRSIGFVRTGMPVQLRYQAFPFQKFGQYEGEVREVAAAAIRPDDVAGSGLTAVGGAEPLYRMRVSLQSQAVTAYGKSIPLRTGMVLEASVLLERRRLYEWVLDPLYAVTGRL